MFKMLSLIEEPHFTYRRALSWVYGFDLHTKSGIISFEAFGKVLTRRCTVHYVNNKTTRSCLIFNLSGTEVCFDPEWPNYVDQFSDNMEELRDLVNKAKINPTREALTIT